MAANSDDAWEKCDRVYTNEKAGMAQVDKERVKKTIYDMSKDSEHFKNEQRKQRQLDRRIDQLKAAADQLTDEDVAKHTRYRGRRSRCINCVEKGRGRAACQTETREGFESGMVACGYGRLLCGSRGTA